jgi:hypothetical protein
MLGSQLLAFLIFPIGVLYLVLHAGPLFRFWYEPSIRGGTRWQFFASEVALFTGWMLCAPAVWNSPVGRAAVLFHLGMHVVFTLTDRLAHEFLLASALTPRARSPLMWAAKELGLVIDTATHAVVVFIAGRALPSRAVLASILLALAAFAVVTRGYLRRYGAPPLTEQES